MSVNVLLVCSHFASMSPESCLSLMPFYTLSRSEHPNTHRQWCIYKDSDHLAKGPARSSTAWTKANGFVSSRPVIPNAPGPGVSIPHKLQHRFTFGMPGHGGASRTAPALCSCFAIGGMSPELHRIETERFAMSLARRFETERFAKLPGRSHYQ